MRAPILLLLFAVGAAAQEVTAVLEWQTGTLGDPVPLRVPLDETPPEGVKLPEIPALPGEIVKETPKPLYGRVVLSDRSMLTLIVEPTRFWVDRDLDGDLSREPPTAWLGSATRYRNIHLKVRFAGQRDAVDLPVVIAYRPDAKPPRLEVTARAFRSGAVVLAGRLRRVALGDADGNLRFDRPDLDPLFVDLDGDGRLGPHEEIRAGVAFALQGTGYLARVPDASGARVLFRAIADVPPPPRRPWKAARRATPGRTARGRGDLAAMTAKYRTEAEANNPGWVRLRLAYDIGHVGTPEAFALLWRIYKRDDSAAVKAAAIEAMGYVQYVDQAPKVARIATGAKSTPLAVAAVRALHRMNAPDRARTYARLLSHKQEGVAAAAAVHLAYLGGADARATLLAAASKGPRVRNRFHAYRSGTRYFRQPPPVEAMRFAAAGVDERLAAIGLKDLHYFMWPEVRAAALRAARDKVRTNDLAMVLVEILATDGSAEAVESVLPLAERESLTLRARMLDLLQPVRDPGGVAVLAKGVSAHIPEVRLLCVQVLGAMRQGTAALAARIGRERDPMVIKALIKSLAGHGGEQAAAALVAASRRLEKDPDLGGLLLRALADIGLRHEPVRAYFQAKMGSPRWQERVLAISAAARARATSLAPLILKNLDHRAWQVRLAAVQAFRVIRVREAIQPLIGRLHEEQEKRIRRAIGDTLGRLTGENLFADYDLWARWWNKSRETFKVPAKTGSKKAGRATGETRTVARFYGLPVDSDRVVFVLDQSGSMSTGSPTDLKKAIAELLKVARRLSKRAKINVIMFESEIHAWRKALIGVNRATRAALGKFLGDLAPTGGTNLYDGLEMALNHKGCDTIYLLSDGSPTDGKFINDRDILREVRRINELKRITIHCVSLGRDSYLLRQLAEENGGRYTRR